MATSSSPKRSRKAPKPRSAPKSEAQACLEHAGLPAALPHAVFDRSGRLTFANTRMCELLGLSASIEAPLSVADVEGRWPFFNEEMSSKAMFRRMLGSPLKGPLAVETGLKTYKLYKFIVSDGAQLVAAELVRRGDLWRDASSKRALFRSLSHEIRNSVLALSGYLDMLEPRAAREREIQQRMSFALRRLDAVVRRLDELRSGLEIDL